MIMRSEMYQVTGVEREGSSLTFSDADGNGVTLHLDDAARARRLIAAWANDAEVLTSGPVETPDPGYLGRFAEAGE